MKKFIRLYAILLTLAMAVSALAGCGEQGDANASGGAGSSGAYFIGASGPLTGDASSYGISANQGAMLAVEEINKAGGLNGAEFKYKMIDDKATAEDAATAYDTLYDEGMQISLGSVTSGSCQAFAAKAVADHLFAITPSASAAPVIETGDTMFRVCFGDPDQGALAAKELVSKFSKIGCIYDTSDTYSSGIYEAFNAEMKNQKKDFIVQTFDKENNKDFSTQVEALKGCDAIFLPFYYTEAGLVAKACVAKGVGAELFGCDGFDGIASQVDSSVTNNIRYITPFNAEATDAKTVAFVDAYKAKFNTVPDQFAADGYDAVYTIFEAMKAAKVDNVKIKPDDLADKVIAVITDPSFVYDGMTGKMKWDSTGACTKEPIIVELKK